MEDQRNSSSLTNKTHTTYTHRHTHIGILQVSVGSSLRTRLPALSLVLILTTLHVQVSVVCGTGEWDPVGSHRVVISFLLHGGWLLLGV